MEKKLKTAEILEELEYLKRYFVGRNDPFSIKTIEGAINLISQFTQQNASINKQLEEAKELINECRLQLEHLNNFQERGTTNSTLSRINNFLNQPK